MSEQPEVNVQTAIPFFHVADMAKSLAFYVDGLGFEIKLKWEPRGTIEWCSIDLGNASLMLQCPPNDGVERTPIANPGQGVTICFICRDAIAIYRSAKANGLDPERPFVGNGMWVTTLKDPDGYNILFESLTDVAEGTEYAEV